MRCPWRNVLSVSAILVCSPDSIIQLSIAKPIHVASIDILIFLFQYY